MDKINTITINNNNNDFYFKVPKEYSIDFSKVKTFDDVIGILKALDIKVYDNFTKFEEFKPFLKEVE